MKIGTLRIAFHRTVRVMDGAKPANLPPNLGIMPELRVADYEDRVPASWDPSGIILALHESEAMWMSFSSERPVALLVGAGGVNALTGQILGTRLEAGNYLVAPPQPWLDGWKAQDGTVYQFVCARYEGGKGATVGEQILGEQSKTGAIGLALHEAKDYTKIVTHPRPYETSGDSPYGLLTLKGGIACYAASESRGAQGMSMGAAFDEMGVGKGGKIIQKVYEDPYGLDVWSPAPSAVAAVYLVEATTFAEITGQPVPPSPVAQEGYAGKWFGLADGTHKDTKGTDKFDALSPVPGVTKAPPDVFPG